MLRRDNCGDDLGPDPLGHCFFRDSGENSMRYLRLEQLAHFEAARRHPWIKANLEHLEQFKTADGTYLFPRDYLPEKPAAYWVTGGKMALEGNPRNKKAIEIESTFRMVKIKKSFGAEPNEHSTR